jgi:lipopolysaccharide export system protein LptA
MILNRVPEFLALVMAALLPVSAAALPDDDEKEMLFDFSHMDMFPEQGLMVFKGADDKPSCIDQGTMRICGNEIRVERADDGTLLKVTATGTPVRFQQQPEADEELAHLSGQTLVFDNVERLLTADGNAEFSQAGTVLTSDHIEYDLDSGDVEANRGAGGGQGQLIVPPQKRK